MKTTILLLLGALLAIAVQAFPGKIHERRSVPVNSMAATGAPLKADENMAPIKSIVDWIRKVFPQNVTVEDAEAQMILQENSMSSFLEINTVRNLTSDFPDVCPDVTMIFGKGTSEIGNVGMLVGPEFFNAVETMLSARNMTFGVQGIQYNASPDGFLAGGDSDGSTKMQVVH